MTIKKQGLPSARKHTFHFLEQAREVQAIYLNMDVEASELKKSRASYKQNNISISYVSYVISAISKAIEKFPEVNTSVHGKWHPKYISYDQVHAKFTINKQLGNQQIVVSNVIEDSNEKSLQTIQEHIDRMKKMPFETGESFESVRKLQSLPVWLGRIIYKQILNNPDERLRTQGSFTVTSLGHLPVQQIYPITSNTICFGIGGIIEKPVIKDGAIIVTSIMPLSMTFDHRAIDGALAAEFLNEVKTNLENWEEKQWQDDQKSLSMMSS
ncbi:2-oxo acid dehydrogenase subunit E2 [Anaerobacillus sp. 1_MG-2023]|uniref:2-oxo acid dehydrogenase subunit E2 n=1 Tax=Anaerobacillus sp. 1_MG-2023 TaxID=3062655 RepID=UPI0026E360C5|nr:2-oxo acid dehydrogenase subunit E2 [Anaerobacillus sp. 1_MG-2023]MDO6657353.1 2-oxo acid dehydrogenase subunit E2 [Anaerobacillus sp. 1_MG-2023]